MSLEKRNVIVAPFPRTMNQIFSERDLKRLASFANVLTATNAPVAVHYFSEGASTTAASVVSSRKVKVS
jgi:hypothetical protein